MATRRRLAVSKYKVCDMILVSSSFLLCPPCSGLLCCISVYIHYEYIFLMLHIGSSCTNVNFAFRGVCNRCGSARPSGGFGGGAGAGGRGRGRGSHDSSGPGRAPGAPAGLFGPNDWPCPM